MLKEAPSEQVMRSAFSTRTIWLVAILLGILAIGSGTAAAFVVKGRPRPDDLLALSGFGFLSLLATAGVAICFAFAREGRQHGRVRQLTLHEQVVAASLMTGFAVLGAVGVIESREWVRLPLFLVNPMLILTWAGVAQKRLR